MKSVAKSILIAILASIFLLLLMNFIFFVPWYMTLVTETFSVSQMVSTDNYLKDTYYDDTMDRIKDRPIFETRDTTITLVVLNDSGLSAIGDDDPDIYYTNPSVSSKPYRQRGRPLSVTFTANYPLTITLWGTNYSRDIPVSFSLTTSGLKYYKDLDD